MALVLCVGTEEMLMKTRRLILEQAGHKVIAGRSEPEISEAAQRYSFDVAVIGQTVDAKRKKRIFEFIRASCPNAKVLELYPLHSRRILESADDWLAVPADVPRDLAEHVAALAARR